MFKKLLLLTAALTSCNVFQATATIKQQEVITINNDGTETRTITTYTTNRGGFGKWLAHCGTAWLCYRGVNEVRKSFVEANLPYSFWMPERQQSNTALMRLTCAITGLYVAYKLTNSIHESMSDEPYRGAHLLGFLLS
jgi:hypothetical protein